jgi:cytochrome c-type biogenesis protein
MPWVQRISGAILVTVGILMFTGALTRMAAVLQQYTPSWVP